MKRLLTFILATLFVTTGQAQQTYDDENDRAEKKQQTKLVIPGPGHIDVEQLNRHIDTRMDISRLTISELRILRNAFAARQGYPFMSSELLSLFKATSWYEKLYYDRYENLEDKWDQYTGPEQNNDDSWRTIYMQRDQNIMPLKYSQDEQDFIKRIKARENKLRKRNFRAANGDRVNTDNIINIYQLTNMPDNLRRRLARNGFAIVPADNRQMFHVYERNDYHVFPNFVTTDIFLQLFHLYFDCTMREVERKTLFEATAAFCQTMRQAMLNEAAQTTADDVRDAAEYGVAYFTIAQMLLSGNNNAAGTGSTGPYGRLIADEMSRIMAETDDFSDFIGGYEDIKFGYSLFRPRGHYTHGDTLGRYFRAMMWLQSVPFGTDSEQQMKRAMVMAKAVAGNADTQAAYRRITEPITFLMGSPDNVTIMQLYDEIAKTGMSVEELFNNKKRMQQVCNAVEAIGKRQTRIRPKYERTSHCKINLMPQRYMPDAEVLQEMVDYENEPTLRDTPRGLDVMAAMRWSAAERLLIDEMGENKRWDGFKPTLERMKRRMDSIDWSETVATRWIESLTTLADNGTHMPYFMLTPEWQKKCLNTALASWAELKHDAILYAKQPMGAECGGAGPPEPVTKGYVEPNVKFWEKAIALIDATTKVLNDHALTTDKTKSTSESVREKAEFLLRISEKELTGKRVTDEEYDAIRIIGSNFEYLSLDMLREPDQYLLTWDDVQGPNKNIAVIADVYTANADNNPLDKHSILYEGVGNADEIYVIVEIDGFLYLTRGAVFFYRELKQPINAPRITDEEWQELLKKAPDTGRQKWMEDITVPTKDKPEDNERVFYSSGC